MATRPPSAGPPHPPPRWDQSQSPLPAGSQPGLGKHTFPPADGGSRAWCPPCRGLAGDTPTQAVTLALSSAGSPPPFPLIPRTYASLGLSRHRLADRGSEIGRPHQPHGPLPQSRVLPYPASHPTRPSSWAPALPQLRVWGTWSAHSFRHALSWCPPANPHPGKLLSASAPRAWVPQGPLGATPTPAGLFLQLPRRWPGSRGCPRLPRASDLEVCPLS